MQRVLTALAVAAMIGSCSSPTPTAEPIVVDGAKDAFSAAGRAALKAKFRASDQPLVVQVRLVDDYGQEVLLPVVTLSWAKADLDKIAWNKMSDESMANLANVRIDGAYGVIAFAQWCGDYSQLSPRLCRHERARAEDEWATRPV